MPTAPSPRQSLRTLVAMLALGCLVAGAVPAPASGATARSAPRSMRDRLLARPAPTTATVMIDCYYDIDTDGVQDPDEQRLGFYSFRLLDESGRVVHGGMTGKGPLYLTGIAPGRYTVLQLHPDESGLWFNTTGNLRTPITLKAGDRRGLRFGTSHSEDGAFLPRNTWALFPDLIPADALVQVNALAPFSGAVFATPAELGGFAGGDGGDARERLARELAGFVIGIEYLAGSTRCAIAHEQRWKEAALLVREAEEVWRSGDATDVAAMTTALARHNTGPVAYVPLQAPMPIY